MKTVKHCEGIKEDLNIWEIICSWVKRLYYLDASTFLTDVHTDLRLILIEIPSGFLAKTIKSDLQFHM